LADGGALAICCSLSFVLLMPSFPEWPNGYSAR